MTGRLIANTSEPMRHPWPEDMHVKGGGRGLVPRAGGGSSPTAFVEAFPPGAFVRGEGATIAEAEDDCWAKYQRKAACPHDQGFDRGGCVNGAVFCRLCGTWFSSSATGFDPLPEHYENRSPSLFGQALTGDPAAIGEVLGALLGALARPHGQPGDNSAAAESGVPASSPEPGRHAPPATPASRRERLN